MMTSEDLNKKFIKKFPEFEQAYQDETEWQEGDKTGSHVIYGDVFLPVLIELLKAKQYQQAQKYLDFLELLLETDDEYAIDVVAVTMIEGIVLDSIDKGEVRSLLGQRTGSIFDEIENWSPRS